MSPRGPRWLVEKVWCWSFAFFWGPQACVPYVYICGTSGTSAKFWKKNSKFWKFFGLRKFFKNFFQTSRFQKSAKNHLISITCSFEQNRRKIIDFRAFWNFLIFENFSSLEIFENFEIRNFGNPLIWGSPLWLTVVSHLKKVNSDLPGLDFSLKKSDATSTAHRFCSQYF